MRLLLGEGDKASLLMEVNKVFDPNKFKFYVVNGDWEGSFNNGVMTVNHTKSKYPIKILSDNQGILKGQYNEVIENWNGGTHEDQQSRT